MMTLKNIGTFQKFNDGTKQVFDDNGRLLLHIFSNGKSVHYVYDNKDRCISEIYFDANDKEIKRISHTYDDNKTSNEIVTNNSNEIMTDDEEDIVRSLEHALHRFRLLKNHKNKDIEIFENGINHCISIIGLMMIRRIYEKRKNK